MANLPDIVIPREKLPFVAQHSTFVDILSNSSNLANGEDLHIKYEDLKDLVAPHEWGIFSHSLNGLIDRPDDFAKIFELILHFSRLTSFANLSLQDFHILEEWVSILTLGIPIDTDQDERRLISLLRIMKQTNVIPKKALNGEQIVQQLEGELNVQQLEDIFSFTGNYLPLAMGTTREDLIEIVENFRNSYFTPEKFAKLARNIVNERQNYLILSNFYTNTISLDLIQKVGNVLGLRGGKRRKGKKTRKIRRA